MGDYLISGPFGNEWLSVLIFPRTKENWMMSELDRRLESASLQQISTWIIRGRVYSYIAVWAEIEYHLNPDELTRICKDLRRACVGACTSIRSNFGWCDFMSLRQFVAHDRRMAEECFGVRAVRKIKRPNPEM